MEANPGRRCRRSSLAFTQDKPARPGLGSGGEHPQIHMAMRGLSMAARHLERAEHDFGGHRAKALALREIDDMPLAEIAYVQFSDVPRAGLEPGKFTDRLPPGQGVVPFAEFFALLSRKGYRGFLSYEAPNPAAWARPADDVARYALAATRRRLPSGRGDLHSRTEMRSVADLLRAEDQRELLALTPAERVALALALGVRDLEAFRAAQSPPLDAAEAARELERRRQPARRRSRCIEELIGRACWDPSPRCCGSAGSRLP